MKANRPIIVLTGRSRPHELFLLCFALAFGSWAVIVGPNSSPVWSEWQSLPVMLWGFATAVSAVLSLVGSYWRGSLVTGLSLERMGLWANALCLFVFMGAAVQHMGGRVYFTAGILLAWVLAHVVRALQIRKDLLILRGAGNGATT